MKKKYRLLPYLNFILTCLIIFLFIQSICLAENLDFTFEWDANHPNDNVVKYRIYWSTTSDNYNQTDSKEILIRNLDDQNNPQWTLTISGADPNQIYYFVVTAEDNEGYESDYSNEVEGVGTISLNVPPNTPVLSSPTDETDDVSLTPDLQTDNFSDPDIGDTHVQTQWQIRTENKLILDITSTSHLTSLPVPTSILDEGTTYSWRAKFSDGTDFSNWPDPYSFTTLTTLNDIDPPNGIPDDQEVDDTVDLDGDGTPDNNEPDDIKSIETVYFSETVEEPGRGMTAIGNAFIGVQRTKNVASIVSLESIDPATIPNSEGYNLPFGLITFKLTVDNPGDTAEVTIYFSETIEEEPGRGLITAMAAWYKYDTINGWQDYTDHVTFDVNNKLVILELKDGDYGDVDGTANGIIVDSNGLAASISDVVSDIDGDGEVGGDGGGSDTGEGGGCFISTAAFDN